MLDFVNDSLDRAKSFRWVIATGHHPFESSSSRYSHLLTPRDYIAHFQLKPKICSKTHFYLAGHSHHLEHYRAQGCLSQFFIAGGGGASIYDTTKGESASRFASPHHGFLTLDVNHEHIEFKFINVNGEQIYAYKTGSSQ
jgi:hypothetical protein